MYPWAFDVPPPLAVRELNLVTGARRLHRPTRWEELRPMRIRGALYVQSDAPGAVLTLTGDIGDGAVRVVGGEGTVLVDIRWSAVREARFEPLDAGLRVL